MEQTEQLILEPLLQEATIKKRQLLPIWIKIFCWFFLLGGLVAPLLVVAGLLFNDVQASLALYGMETASPLSIVGLLIAALFFLKGIVAYGLWWEKSWAINLGIADAIIGIFFCVLLMTPLGLSLELLTTTPSFRLELVALIPYLIKLQKLKPIWK
ncbi:hypothetical protein [Flavisolibacter tropicus]|uniref:Uncharacterized protein n=1 Tax=Flavisolibacter tropicus TaxID=1492898 RepID=A0A172TWI0_9BACT|nr:hypothetical protein [Flavisolibacter tropicus]ANE51471.1 hypothetical protein SY85_14115 [Flavisolibacter tropicus]